MILTDTGADFEPTPTGEQQAICTAFFDIGLQRSLDGFPVHQCVLLWELAARKKNGMPFTVTKRYTASLSELATLRKHLESWRGRQFTAEELKRFDSDNIPGKQCRLFLVDKVKAGGKRRAEVDTILPPERGQAVRQTTEKGFIPDWVSKAIAEQLPANQGAATAAPARDPAPDDIDDEIPF